MADRTVSVKLRADIADYVAKMRDAGNSTRDLEAAGRELRKALDDEADAAGRARVSEAKLTEVRANSKATVAQLAAAEEEHSASLRKVEAASLRTQEATARYTAAQKKAAVDTDSSSKQIEDSFSRLSARANAAFDIKTFAGLSVGLPAAAGIGVAGAGALLVGATALFGAFAAKQALYAEDVNKAWDTNLGKINDSVLTLSHQFEGPLTEAADMVGARYEKVFPEIAAGVSATVPAVTKLTGAALDLGENALPGLVRSAQNSGAVLDGLGSFAAKAGAGVSDMFDHIAASSGNAGKGLSTFGDITRDALDFTGRLVENLAANQGELTVLQGGLHAVEQTLINLTQAGSGAIGFLHGFGSAGTGALSTVQALSALLGLLPPEVTQFAGSFTAAGLIASKFGIDVGNSFDGLGGKIKAAGNGLTGFSKVSSVAGEAITGLVGAAINPATLAVAGLGIGLQVLGQHQQEAAQEAAQHAEGVRRLTQALRDDNGVAGEHVNQTNIQALADKNAAANLSVLGKNLGDAKLAIEGNTSAYQGLLKAGRDRLTVVAQNAQLTKEDQQALAGLADEALNTGKNFAQLGQEGGRGAQVLGELAGGARDVNEAVLNGLGAVGEQIKQQREAHQAYLDSEHALTGLAASQIEARDATVQHTQALYQQQNAALGYRGAVLNTKQALDQFNKTQKDGKASADDRARAELALEQAMAAQEQAAYQSAYANSTATSEAGRQADATRAQNAEAVKIANTFAGKLPQSLEQTISKMTVSEAKAAGLKVTYNRLGEAVYQLPNGKQITITSNAATVINQIASIQRKVDSLTGKTIYVRTVYTNGSSNSTRFGNQGAGRGNAALADGGLITHHGARRFAVGGSVSPGAPVDVTAGGLLVGPGGPRQDLIPAWLSNNEFVVNAKATARNLPTLIAINRGEEPLIQRQIISGAASVQQFSPRVVVAPPAAAAPGGGAFEGELFLDSGQFLGMVRGEIRQSNRQLKRAVSSGAGGAR